MGPTRFFSTPSCWRISSSPGIILPLASVLESLVGFFVSLGVLLVLQVVLKGFVPGISILLLLIATPLQFVFNFGLTSIAGRLAVPFRDINNFTPYFKRVWLYLSPIIWPLSFLEVPPQSETEGSPPKLASFIGSETSGV